MCNGSVRMTGRASVIDRLGIRSLPIGIESFDDVAQRFVYVDKTAIIADLIDRSGVTLFCRPRRFGKSLQLRTLQSFFEAPVEGFTPDRASLFEGLAIMNAEERHVAQRAIHPVIYLGLNRCGGSTWEACRSSIAQHVISEYRRHGYLLDSLRIMSYERDQFERMCRGQASSDEVESSLEFLATLLARHHGAQTVILIDEYDKIVTEGYLHGYRDEATAFLKRWLTGALKGTVDLFLAVLTGVQRVSKESIFSDLNNFTVDTALDHPFAEAFGFTVGEVEALATLMGHVEKVGELADWYDGYVFGGERAYNPWSVLSYLRDGCVAQPYWTNTSSNDVIKRMIACADARTNAQLTALAEGGSVEAPLDLSVVYGQIDSDTKAIWPQLYLAGYVTTDDVNEPNDTGLIRRLRVPNLEVAQLFRRELVDRAWAAGGGRESLLGLHAAITSGDTEEAACRIEQALLDTVSYHDLQDENSCHMWLLSLLYGMDGYRLPRSNREVGRGRPDVVVEPDGAHETGLPAIVAEVKFERDAIKKELRDLADKALDDQALPQRYAQGLAGNGVVLWGVAFDNHKHVAVAARRINSD